DVVLRARQERPGPARTAHHFVEDQQDAVAVANLANFAEIAGNGRYGAVCCADDRFRDKADDRFRADPENLLLERTGDPVAIAFRTLAGLGKAIFEAGVGQRDIDEQRLVGSAPPGASSCGQRAQCVAVVAEAPGDDVSALRLSAL